MRWLVDVSAGYNSACRKTVETLGAYLFGLCVTGSFLAAELILLSSIGVRLVALVYGHSFSGKATSGAASSSPLQPPWLVLLLDTCHACSELKNLSLSFVCSV